MAYNKMSLIYIATDRLTHLQYVGQTTCELGKRIRGHRHRGFYFAEALRKQGRDGFSFVLVPCPKEQLNQWERFFISKLGTLYPQGYNLTTGGDSKWKVTGEVRRKMSLAHRGRVFSAETRLKLSRAKLGRHLSLETRKKISATRMGKYTGKENGMFGKKHSAETKAKIREAHKRWLEIKRAMRDQERLSGKRGETEPSASSGTRRMTQDGQS